VQLGAFETAYVSFERDGHDAARASHSVEFSGSDFLSDGAAFSAALHGNRAHETVDGNQDAGAVNGSNENDTLQGSSSNDSIYGNAGNDRLIGGAGDDRLFGGSGYDDLEGDAVGIELWGTFGHSRPVSRSSNDDTLKGGEGDDFLVGGAGNDRLEGEEGNDHLSGGLDSDIFVFEGAFGHDVIADFDIDEDQIAITSPEALTSLSREELIQEFAKELGNDVVIDFDQDHSITLRNMTLEDLEEADLFVA
jgi:Ca2+-binding RTX toxin-like protein